MKLVRIVFLYMLFLLITLVVSVVLFGPGGGARAVTFWFVAPALLAWQYEKRRASKTAVATTNAAVEHRPEAITASRADRLRAWQQPGVSATGQTSRTAAPRLEAMEASIDAERAAHGRASKVSAAPKTAPTAQIEHVNLARQVEVNRHQGWVPKGQTVLVAGRELGGMIYVGVPPTISYSGFREKCRAYIDPSLSVAREARDVAGTAMPYWPGYSSIPSECRATYLDWLADGASNQAYNAGYMFLYFYGLERRFFVDNPADAEKQLLLDEVRRLRELFPESHSAQR